MITSAFPDAEGLTPIHVRDRGPRSGRLATTSSHGPWQAAAASSILSSCWRISGWYSSIRRNPADATRTVWVSLSMLSRPVSFQGERVGRTPDEEEAMKKPAVPRRS